MSYTMSQRSWTRLIIFRWMERSMSLRPKMKLTVAIYSMQKNSAATQSKQIRYKSKQIRYFSAFIIFSDALSKHCLLFFLFYAVCSRKNCFQLTMKIYVLPNQNLNRSNIADGDIKYVYCINAYCLLNILFIAFPNNPKKQKKKIAKPLAKQTAKTVLDFPQTQKL